MAPIRAVVDSTRLEHKIGDILVRENGAEPGDSDSEGDDGAAADEGDGRMLLCDSCMVFVFESLSIEYLESNCRGSANLQVFLFMVHVMSFFKLRVGLMFEDVRIGKSEASHGDYRHAEPSEELREFMRDVPAAETTDANLRFFLDNHSQKHGEFSCGMRAWLFLPTGFDLAGALLQFVTHEIPSASYQKKHKYVPEKIKELSSIKTLSRVISMACGDLDSGGRGADIAQRHGEFGGDVTRQAVEALDPRKHFNACVQIRETADILTSNTANDAHRDEMLSRMHADPEEYGTLVAACDGTATEVPPDLGEEGEEGDAADAASPPAARGARTGGFDEGRGRAQTGYGVSRPLPRNFLPDAGKGYRAARTEPKCGTLRTPRGVRFIGLAYDCMITLLAQGDKLPFEITPSQQFYMQYISSDNMDPRVPIYYEAAPIHKRSGGGDPDSPQRESKDAHAARHAACRSLEDIAHLGRIPGTGEQRSKKKRGIDAVTPVTDIEVEVGDIRTKIDNTTTWCAESPSSPFANRSDPRTNCLLSELIEMIKMGMLHSFFSVLFSPQAHACDFIFKIQEFFEENLTPEAWSGRTLSDYRRDSQGCAMDPWSMCAVTETLHGLFEGFDLTDRLYNSHNLQLSIWVSSMGASMPTDDGHRKCLHNKKFAGPRDCSKSYSMSCAMRKMPSDTFMEVHHQTASFSTGVAVDHNQNECSAQQHKTKFEDEGGTTELGLSDGTMGASRLKQNHEFDAALNKRKEQLGNSATMMSHRAYTDDEGQVRVVSRKHSTVGATITGTNSSARCDPAISSRYFEYNLTGCEDGLRERANIAKNQVMASTDQTSLLTADRNAYQKSRYQSVFAIVAVCMQMRHAGLLDFGAQDKMTSDVIVATMQRLKECTDSREMYKVQGYADVLAVLIRVTGGMYHASGLRSIGVELSELREEAKQGGAETTRRVDHTLDTAQPYPVPFAIWQMMRRMAAPSPAFAMYAIGDTIGVVHSDVTKKLLMVKLATICGLTHYDFRSARDRPGGRAELDGYARMINFAREDTMAGDAPGADMGGGERLNLEYADTQISLEEATQQLMLGGFSRQIVCEALEKIIEMQHTELIRPAQADDWNSAELDALHETGARRNAVWKVWQSNTTRREKTVNFLKIVGKKKRLLVSVGAMLQAVEQLDLSNVAGSFGPPGQQRLPKSYTDWGQGTAKQDEVRRTLGETMPGGQPKFASMPDGTLPLSRAKGKPAVTWYDVPNVCCYDAIAPTATAAAAAAAAAQHLKSVEGFHTLSYKTSMDDVLGATRAERLGFSRQAAAETSAGVHQQFKSASLKEDDYTSVLQRWAYVANGCYSELRQPDGTDDKMALMFPATAASIAASAGPSSAAFASAPARPQESYLSIYPDCFINGRDRGGREADDRIGQGCCPVVVAKARDRRSLNLRDEWTVHDEWGVFGEVS